MTQPRRLTAVITALCTLGLGTLGLAGSVPAAATPAAPGSTSFAVVTYNVRHALSDATAANDIWRLGTEDSADIIGLQEMASGTRRAAVRSRVVDCETCQFRASWPNVPGASEVPILFRHSMFALVSKGEQKISDATYVGPDGAGPSTIAPKYLSYVQLQHRLTGQIIYVINNHTVASVQGPDGGPNWKNDERLELYRKHMAALSKMITEFKATGAAVLTTGDFNVNYRRDVVLRPKLFPYYNMSRVGVYASYRYLGTPAGGTQMNRNGNDTRIIDYVSALEHPAIRAETQAILGGYSSDHRPVKVRYSIASAPDAPIDVRAVPLERSAQVSWSPAQANGNAVTGYTVTAWQDGTEVDSLTVPGTATSATVTGLTEWFSYTFTVRATNRIGTGPQSLASESVTPTAVPPETQIVEGPRNGSFVTSSRATFGYTSSVPGSTFACSLDGVEQACDGSSTTFSGLSQATHDFAVAATDPEDDPDVTPATRWWTVPLDSTAFARTASWTAHTGAAYYTGHYLEATRGRLSREVEGMSKLALVATKGPGHGVVKVYLDGALLKLVDLSADRLHRGRVIPIQRFDTPQTGKVRVVVEPSGRTVRIEGLGVATR